MAKNYDDIGGVWRTIGGRRVFIKNGQSLSEAMIESGKFKNLREEYKKDKEEKEQKGIKEISYIGQDNKEHKMNSYDYPEDRDAYHKYLEDKYGTYKEEEIVKKDNSLSYAKLRNDFYNKDNSEWKQEEWGVTTRKTNEGTNYIQGVKKGDGSHEYTRTDYDKNGNELSSKTYKTLEEAKSANTPKHTTDWKKEIEKNNAQMEKDVTDLQNQINEYRNKSYQSNNSLERYQYWKEAEKLQDKYYERFRENERANAKIKVEEPNEKYMNVEAYAGYKDKFNKTWGEDGSNAKTVSAKMYTNDEFMEHLEDANWHSERSQLLDANLTNKELEYIKNRTKVSAWGVDNLTGKEQVDKLIKEAKSQSNTMNDTLRRKAYEKYMKEHPNSKKTFSDFMK